MASRRADRQESSAEERTAKLIRQQLGLDPRRRVLRCWQGSAGRESFAGRGAHRVGEELT
jgi:hypothetical protein